MTDIEIAKGTIDGHSVCFCKDGKSFTLDGMGLSPLMRMINEGKDLHGYSAADVVVGKAAAMLFKKLGVVSVHGKLMSETGADFLEKSGITFTYDTLTDYIKNRKGTDMCPMEKTVLQISDAEEGFATLKRSIDEMMKTKI
jgi:hypothetical protein